VKVIVYVDGFNLHYGALKGSPYKWLDLEKLSRALLPRDEIVGIRYFTSRVSSAGLDPEAAKRQDLYLRALRTLPLVRVHFGAFLSHAVSLPLAENPSRFMRVLRLEEKGTDVSLASHLLVDCFQRRCDAAVIVSNDSDLAETVVLARQEMGAVVGVVNPRLGTHPSREWTAGATFVRQLKTRHLAQSRLPSTIQSFQGIPKRPDSWMKH
jgi:uncharacterized LabA/DUF88 family protein